MVSKLRLFIISIILLLCMVNCTAVQNRTPSVTADLVNQNIELMNKVKEKLNKDNDVLNNLKTCSITAPPDMLLFKEATLQEENMIMKTYIENLLQDLSNCNLSIKKIKELK